MNSFRSAVWIQIKESTTIAFLPAARRGTSFLTALSFALAMMVAPSLHAQNSAPAEKKDNKDMKIKVITDKDGKTEVMELNGDDMLAKPEVAKMLKDMNFDINKFNKDGKGNVNLCLKRLLKTEGDQPSSQEVTITRGGKGSKKECVVMVNGSCDTSKCKAMVGNWSQKGACMVKTTGSKDGKQCKVICINKSADDGKTADATAIANSKDGKQCKVICISKSIGDGGDRIETTSIVSADGSNEEIITENIRGPEVSAEAIANTDGDNVEIIKEEINSSEKPTRIFVRKFKDDDSENVAIIETEITSGDDEDIIINSNGNDNGIHNRSVKFIIKQVGENGDPSKVKVMIRKYVTDEVKVTEPKEQVEPKLQEMPALLNLTTLNLAPNPNKGQFTLSFSLNETGNTSISIVDIAGREVYSESLSNFTGEYSKALDLTSKARGEYLLKITQNGKSATANIVLE